MALITKGKAGGQFSVVGVMVIVAIVFLVVVFFVVIVFVLAMKWAKMDVTTEQSRTESSEGRSGPRAMAENQAPALWTTVCPHTCHLRTSWDHDRGDAVISVGIVFSSFGNPSWDHDMGVAAVHIAAAA